MFSAFTNSLKIPELRSRIFYTLSLLFVARVAAQIPLPGIDPLPLMKFFEENAGTSGGGLVALYSMFTGGALTKGAIGALGIMPYISATIIFQLMTAVVPALSRLQQEGDVGRQKLTQYTRYATVLICLVQGMLLLLALQNPENLFHGYDVSRYGPIVIVGKWSFIIESVIFMTAGTMLLMWLGEQITQRGIGNGVSLLITIGILSQIPTAARMTWHLFFRPVGTGSSLGLPQAAAMVLLFFAVITGIIMVVQGQRKIPVQYAKRVVGNKVMGGQSSFLPLKVNYSGVMPVIFGQAILMFPQQILSWIGAARPELKFFTEISQNLQPGYFFYYFFYATLILFFSYFWVSVMFKPIQIADDLKKYGGYIPGVRPGEPTAQFLDFIMTRLTLAGAVFLTVIAVLPDVLLYNLNVPHAIGYFFGGTGMLITVGVILDTMRQIETFLLQRHYDGFLRKGHVRSRADMRQGMTGDALSTDAVLKLALPVLGLLLLGGAIAAYRAFLR
jgi:preprotein translocase subunit SecY